MTRHWHFRLPIPRPGKRARDVGAYVVFEFLVGLGVSRTIAYELSWWAFAR